MKKIHLKQLQLRNFKGIKSVEINFNEKETFIQGDNGAGKSTVFDSFNWLLWGKNSHNETQFEIKTLDENNEPIHKLEHSVKGVFLINDEEITLGRIYKEKWTKKHGEEFQALTGHTTEYYINEVPHNQTEYNKQIDKILPSEIARLITDPIYFNLQLRWEDRRKILTDISGGVSDEFILSENPNLTELQKLFDSGFPLQKKREELQKKIYLSKEKLNEIPSRLDEVDRTTPDPINENEINEEISFINSKIASIEKLKLDNQAKANADFEKKNFHLKKINDLKIKINVAKSEIIDELNADAYKIKQKRGALIQKLSENNDLKTKYENEIKSKKSEIDELNQKRADFGVKYNEIKENVFQSTIDEVCFNCNQQLPDSYIFEIKNSQEETFNKAKSEKLQTIINDANDAANQINSLKSEIEELESKLTYTLSQIESVDKTLSEIEEIDFVYEVDDENTKIKPLIDELKRLESVNIQTVKVDESALENEIKEYKSKLQELNRSLLVTSQIKAAQERKSELINQQKEIAQEIANMEKVIFQINEFTRLKMQIIENRVNQLFSIVKFKMFKELVNGNEAPDCVCLLDGVPFSDLNTASKINAGLDVIVTLQNYYNIYAPVFIDNRESITNILEMPCQVVNLEKVTGVKELIVK